MSEESTGWSMGLRGAWASVANLTAVALLCVLFYQAFHAQIEQAREDRTVFRGAIEKLSENSDKQWRAIRTLSGDVRRIGEKLEHMKPEQEAEEGILPLPLPHGPEKQK